jgi:AcrR family transcriptional regulator
MTTKEVRRRPGGRSTQVRASVLAATLELLAEAGPSDLTIAEVALRAGVHETSIYRRWGTRERLVLEAMSELSVELIPVPDTGSLREDLTELGQELVRYVESPLGQALTRTMAMRNDDEQATEVRAEFWNARYAECSTVVDRAVARREVPASIDGRLLLEVFIAPVHFRLLLSREAVTADFLEVLADVVVKGVSRAGPR